MLSMRANSNSTSWTYSVLLVQMEIFQNGERVLRKLFLFALLRAAAVSLVQVGAARRAEALAVRLAEKTYFFR